MDEMPEIIIVAGAAAQDAQATIEREMIARGREVRVIVFDDRDHWPTLGDSSQLGEQVWCGVDLVAPDPPWPPKPEPGLSPAEFRRLYLNEFVPAGRTHPTTASELRRAERGRRR